MNGKKPNTRLQGWTLSETLVMMIVSGIVFLAVMDGMVLFGKYTSSKTRQITANMALYEGYYLLQHLAASTDSVSMRGDHIGLFREEAPIAELIESDSLLVARRGIRTDTLMFGIFGLRVTRTADISGTDSIALNVYTPTEGSLRLSFPIVPAANKLVMKKLEEQEKQYAY